MPLSLIEQVRLNIGDLGTPPFLTDAQIQHFLDQEADNVDQASGRAAVALAFLFATKADQTTGRMSIGFSKRADAYRQMAIDFGVDGVQTAPPYVGGVSVAEAEASRQETDLIQPAFTRDLHDDRRAEVPDAGSE